MTEDQYLKNLKELYDSVSLSESEHAQGLTVLLQKVEARNTAARLPESTFMDRFSFAGVVDRVFQPFVAVGDVMRAVVVTPVTLLLLVVFVFGGLGAFMGATSQQATPEDPTLFTLKTALERTQLALQFSTEKKTIAKVQLLERRVNEIQTLTARNVASEQINHEAVAEAIYNARSHAEEVQKDLEELSHSKLSAADKAEVDQINELVDKVVTYSIAVNDLESLPEDVKGDAAELVTTITALGDIVLTIPEDEPSADDPSFESTEESDAFFTDQTIPTTTTTTLPAIIEESAVESETDETVSADQSEVGSSDEVIKYYTAPVTPKKPTFDLEADTKPVHIGD